VVSSGRRENIIVFFGAVEGEIYVKRRKRGKKRRKKRKELMK
jgi:hypothetical protein